MTETIVPIPASLKEKKLRKAIEERLAITLLEYRPILGDKKFDNRIKKVGKLFAEDIIRLSSSGKKKNKKVKTAPADK
ncbi:MAG: hypothetical protein HYX40_11855 [Sphingobacteriales bacterium]|nr:hypothetical protein [Sphingobacteriales bacterium]